MTPSNKESEAIAYETLVNLAQNGHPGERLQAAAQLAEIDWTDWDGDEETYDEEYVQSVVDKSIGFGFVLGIALASFLAWVF